MKKQTVLTIISIITIIFSQYQFGYAQHQLECNQSPTGFDKEAYYNNGKKFPESDYLRDLPALRKLNYAHKRGQDANIKIIDINASGGCNNWKDCGFDQAYDYFLIVPGDYRALGPLSIRASGTAERTKIISYYNPNGSDPYEEFLPINRSMNPNRHVIVEALDIHDADYWIINGLTFSGKSKKWEDGRVGGPYSRITNNADYNIVNRCLFENVVRNSNIRISKSNYNTLQNSVVRNILGTDYVGIWIGGKRSVAIGNRVVNNEIYDCNDGVHLDYKSEWETYGDLSGTIIENNDIYLTRKAYSSREGYACAENAIDIKMGGKTNRAKDVVKVLKNRIWGFRVSDTSCGPSGSNGTGIVVHKEARNVLIKDNVFFDLPEGVGLSHKNDRNTNVAVINNVFYRMKKYNAESAGRAILSRVNADIYYNTIGSAAVGMHMRPRTEGGRVQCNTIINAPKIQPWKEDRAWSALNAWYDCDIASGKVFSHLPDRNIVDDNIDKNGFGDFVFHIQRWTEPEKVIFRGLFAENSSQISLVASQKTHCGPGGEGGRWWTKFMNYYTNIE